LALTLCLEYHVLDFDRAAAIRAGEISATLHGLGRPVEVRDVPIAGIVSVRHAILATRNLKRFQNTNISIVNPWRK
jgi:predicted nucleic acid-binding protein